MWTVDSSPLLRGISDVSEAAVLRLPALDHIADAPDGLDHGGVVTQLLADVADMYVDGAGFAIELIAPDAVQQEVAREHLAAAEHQQLQQLELLQSQRQLLAIAECFIIADVDGQAADMQDAFFFVLGSCAAQQAA